MKTTRIVSILLLLIVFITIPALATGTFATGSSVLTPNPIPSSCSSNCPGILIVGPTLGTAIIFQVSSNVTGHYKKLLGPTSPFNVTLTINGECIANATSDLPITTTDVLLPIRAVGYEYCLWYRVLTTGKSYSIEIKYSHLNDPPFIQTISWTVP